MGAMSSKYNDAPETASRPFDATRDGFVIAGGGGVVVVEALDHALARGARIYAELTGYGATSDGHDMVAPSGEGGERSMRLALSTLPKGRKIDYINAHGTSTPAGDVTEMQAIRRVFGEDAVPPTASTKSMTGHSLGATGVHEAIYSLLMMQGGFIAPSINVTDLDPVLKPGEIVTELREGVELDSVLSNSFGFGGTNATLVFSRYQG
jgi:3-oxoacyl-[acyl-carrier-protein] synthase-1